MPANTLTNTPKLTASASGTTTIELSWEAVQGAVSYELWSWRESGAGWQRIGGVLTGASYTHADLAAGTTYYYVVRAVDANGNRGAWSAYASATLVPAGAPAAAPVLVATPGKGQVTLSWEAVQGAASYELWWWREGGAGWQRIGGVLTGASYTHDNPTPGKANYYAIRALNEHGGGPWSANVGATPL